MNLIRLAARANRTPQKIIQSCPKARQVRHAQDLLWLHEKETVPAVFIVQGLTPS
jgi:hypothetical protein